jgi:hypothetical protein
LPEKFLPVFSFDDRASVSKMDLSNGFTQILYFTGKATPSRKWRMGSLDDF